MPDSLRSGWYAGGEDATTAILSAVVTLSGRAPELWVDLFTHLETAYDRLAIEASADRGETWTPLVGRLEASHQEPVEVPDGILTGWGRRVAWTGMFALIRSAAPLQGEVQVRLLLTTDASTRGLGAWVGRIRVRDDGTDVLDTDRTEDRELIIADGWTRGT